MSTADESLAETLCRQFGRSEPFRPTAYYDRQGDCVEFLLADAPYLARRVNDLLTIYLGGATGKPVGGSIEDAARLAARIRRLESLPDQAPLPIGLLVKAAGYASSELSDSTGESYRALIHAADEVRADANWAEAQP